MAQSLDQTLDAPMGYCYNRVRCVILIAYYSSRLPNLLATHAMSLLWLFAYEIRLFFLH